MGTMMIEEVISIEVLGTVQVYLPPMTALSNTHVTLVPWREVEHSISRSYMYVGACHAMRGHFCYTTSRQALSHSHVSDVTTAIWLDAPLHAGITAHFFPDLGSGDHFTLLLLFFNFDGSLPSNTVEITTTSLPALS